MSARSAPSSVCFGGRDASRRGEIDSAGAPRCRARPPDDASGNAPSNSSSDADYPGIAAGIEMPFCAHPDERDAVVMARRSVPQEPSSSLGTSGSGLHSAVVIDTKSSDEIIAVFASSRAYDAPLHQASPATTALLTY